MSEFLVGFGSLCALLVCYGNGYVRGSKHAMAIAAEDLDRQKIRADIATIKARRMEETLRTFIDEVKTTTNDLRAKMGAHMGQNENTALSNAEAELKKLEVLRWQDST